ncbi:dicarboxylate/amino acid:cation symporter [Phenylobacterium sp. SCN 70-31]|uniref:dicarboxylate/amino acid:cation symporter n=1 Tax=Phenylobacterium sp. SCN 70-31 TaxID=1660129 RepID=UPI00086E53DB|nr:dicarboxylate/amino acid:cation symporter [Phenylobacterium sp. SCN 70-31]ODT89289.1 MAG: sodium:dicarboxylate symporter [Phenylobacterium sp. SCN 70-31]
MTLNETPPGAPDHAPVRRSFLQRWWFDVVLWKRILLALVLGAVVGLALGEAAASLKWLGDLFIRLIRMVVVPLVFLSITSGMAAMGDPRRLGSIGGKVLGFYFATTLIAVILGLVLGHLFQPGVGVDFTGVEARPVGEAPSVSEQLLGIVPLNPVEALANGDILAVIFFAILLGAAILAVGEKAEPVKKVFDGGVEMILFITRVVMEVAPFGVFALVAWVMGTQGFAVFTHVFLLALALVVGCVLQVLLVHGGLLRLVARLPVLPFFRDISDAILVAFSTSSSAATLPVAMRVAEKNLGVSHTVASTALPIGTTISMDGTALYIGLLTMFTVQAFGVELTPVQFLIAGLTITLVAIGTAPVPSASLFMLSAVLGSVGLSAEQTALVVGFVLPFDRLLDMTRTVANSTSDLAVAVTVAKMENELDEEAYRAKPVE